MNYAVSTLVGIYLFIVSFFLFVPIDTVVNTVGDLSGAQEVRMYRLQKESGSTLELQYNGASVLEIESYSVFALLLLNGIDLNGITPKGLAASFFPIKIKGGFVLIPIWSLSPSFWFSGDFGSGSGEFDPFSGVLKLTLTPNEGFKKNYAYLLSKGRADGDSYIFEYKL